MKKQLINLLKNFKPETAVNVQLVDGKSLVSVKNEHFQLKVFTDCLNQIEGTFSNKFFCHSLSLDGSLSVIGSQLIIKTALGEQKFTTLQTSDMGLIAAPPKEKRISYSIKQLIAALKTVSPLVDPQSAIFEAVAINFEDGCAYAANQFTAATEKIDKATLKTIGLPSSSFRIMEALNSEEALISIDDSHLHLITMNSHLAIRTMEKTPPDIRPLMPEKTTLEKGITVDASILKQALDQISLAASMNEFGAITITAKDSDKVVLSASGTHGEAETTISVSDNTAFEPCSLKISFLNTSLSTIEGEFKWVMPITSSEKTQKPSYLHTENKNFLISGLKLP